MQDKQLQIITYSDDNRGYEDLCIKKYKEEPYIYNKNIRVRNNFMDNIYKPIKCSDLYYKLGMFFKWFQSRHIVKGDDGEFYLITKEIPWEYRTSPIFDIDQEDFSSNNIINMTKIESDIDYNKKWNKLLNENSELAVLEKMIESNEIYLLNNSKSTVDFLSDSTTIVAELIKPNTYTDTVDLKPMLSEKIFLNKTCKLDISIKYSSTKKNIYCHDITANAFNINTESDKIIYNNFIQDIGEGRVRVEFLNGIIKVFPLKDDIVDCIISNCLVTYGKK